MALVDEKGNPVSNGEEAPKPGEGEGKKVRQEDGVPMNQVNLKTVSTGTLIDNIAIFRFQEFVIHSDIQRLEHERIQKKELAQSPQTTMLIEKIKEVQIARHNVVFEVNHRLRDLDAAWAARHGVELRDDPLELLRKQAAEEAAAAAKEAQSQEGEVPKVAEKEAANSPEPEGEAAATPEAPANS